MANITKIWSCKLCDVNFIRVAHYNKHILTRKHKNANDAKENITIHFYKCNCGKQYKHESSLYRHKYTCDYSEKVTDEKVADLENIIIKKEEIDYGSIISELKNIIVDQQKQIGELIPRIGNNNNSNNKHKFNINVFLNEQCKDAMTMTKFIDNLKVTIEDLFVTKNKGIAEGITNIITKNMNELSVYERPLHCTDVKRETVYIKSEGEGGTNAQWEKDNEQEKLKKAIKEATYVQSKNLNLYTDNNPDWMDKDHKQTEYMTMVKNSMDDIKKDNRVDKVIKKVCNDVYLNGAGS